MVRMFKRTQYMAYVNASLYDCVVDELTVLYIYMHTFH